jgi:AraC-like DNA-binding protein
LQFQKRLRLLEARRLMLDEDLDAASAAYRVGYNDASHFNREYKSLFGVPPMRDVRRLRAQDKLSTSTIISVRNNARFDADQASAAT